MEKGQQGSKSIKIILEFIWIFFFLIQNKQTENIFFSSSPSLGTICHKEVASKYVMYLNLLVQIT